MASTIAEKILTRASGKKGVETGEIVDANIDLAMSHDNTVLVSKIFKKMDIKKVWNSQRIVIVLDHRTPANTIKTAENHKLIREFVKNKVSKTFLMWVKVFAIRYFPREGLFIQEC
ncbi:hypothetical protein MBGDF03_00193 [Thermoplasmatales archaeon SCGC AB-540-F20]|nr:hypothetical protein MBGDF03_00193 [Thermoplasmatales archaeon SCGC AB-540-F20]